MNRLLAEELFGLLKAAINEFDLPEGIEAPSADAVAFIEREELNSLFSSPNAPQALRLGHKESLQNAMYHHALRETLRQIIDRSQKEQIPFAVLKGEVLQACYPPSMERLYGDIDVHVPPEFVDRFCTLLENLGAKREPAEDDLHVGVVSFTFPNTVHIEIHFISCIHLSTRQLQLVQEAGMFSPDSYVYIVANGLSIPTIQPTFHLFYLLYHLMKHLMARETGTIKGLVDIALFISANYERIDWDAFARFIDQIRYRRVADTIFSVCINKFGICGDFWHVQGQICERELFALIPERSSRYLDFYNYLIWNIYHAEVDFEEDKLVGSRLNFRWWIFIPFLPISLIWLHRRRLWGLEVEMKRPLKANTL